MKGMRVQSIIRELRGEKIDIIEYNDDPVVFATHALSPAKISRVTILDAAEKQMEVIVDDTQLSLAIGKKGQNVRLGAKLLGWRIDIKSEEEKRQEVESQMAALVVPGAPVSVLIDHGLTDKIVEMLMQAGVPTVESLGSMTPEELEAIEGIDPEIVESIQVAVNSYYGQFETSVGAPAAVPAGEAGAEAPAELETEAAAGETDVEAADPEAGTPAAVPDAEQEAVDSSVQADVENESDTIKNRE